MSQYWTAVNRGLINKCETLSGLKVIRRICNDCQLVDLHLETKLVLYAMFVDDLEWFMTYITCLCMCVWEGGEGGAISETVYVYTELL